MQPTIRKNYAATLRALAVCNNVYHLLPVDNYYIFNITQPIFLQDELPDWIL